MKNNKEQVLNKLTKDYDYFSLFRQYVDDKNNSLVVSQIWEMFERFAPILQGTEQDKEDIFQSTMLFMFDKGIAEFLSLNNKKGVTISEYFYCVSKRYLNVNGSLNDNDYYLQQNIRKISKQYQIPILRDNAYKFHILLNRSLADILKVIDVAEVEIVPYGNALDMFEFAEY